MATITEQVLAYQRARCGLDEVLQSVCELVYRYPAGRTGFSEEDGAEFLLRFYPRIRRLVRTYRPQGYSFESYLNATLRWQLRSFALDRSTERIRLRAQEDRNTSSELTGSELVARPDREGLHADSGSHSHRPVAGESPRRPPAPSRKASKRPPHRPSALLLMPGGPAEKRLSPGQAQRFLCISLKIHETLDETICERLAEVVGCSPEWLRNRWQELHEEQAELRNRRAVVRARRDRAWFRLRCIEARLQEAVPGEREELRADHGRWHERYERARDELSRIPQGPSHLQIARVLGIAKGTVDSSVFKFRQELKNSAFRERLAYLMQAT